MNKKTKNFRERQPELKQQISDNPDLLMGTVSSSPAMKHFHLTTKENGKPVTRYVPKAMLPTVEKMTDKKKRTRLMLKELSDINWELLKLKSK